MHFLTSKLYQRVARSFHCYQRFCLVDLGIKVREPETVNFGNDWPMWLCDDGWHEWYSLVNGGATFPSWMKMQLSVITMEWTAHCGSSENLWPPHSNRSFWIPILQTRRKWVLEGTVEHRIKFPHFEHLQVNFPQVRLLYLTQILQFDIFHDWQWNARVCKSIMNSISPSPSLVLRSSLLSNFGTYSYVSKTTDYYFKFGSDPRMPQASHNRDPTVFLAWCTLTGSLLFPNHQKFHPRKKDQEKKE